jgi:hypothetical protein
VDVTVTSIAATAAINGFVEDMRCSCESPVGSVGCDDGDDLVNEPSGSAQARARGHDRRGMPERERQRSWVNRVG